MHILTILPWLYILILVLLSSCGWKPKPPPDPSTLPPSGLFSNSDCFRACWQGLNLGQTSVGELETFLRNSTSSGNFQITSLPDGFLFYESVDVNAVTQNDYLFMLELTGPYNTSLGEVINTLGNPDYVSIYYHTGSEVYYLEAYIEMYYPQEGFVFYSGYQGGLDVSQASNGTVDVCVEVEDVITRVHILEPSSIEDMLNNRYLPWTKPQADIQTAALSQFIHWPGFACVNLT
jgi:hypothetical protein